MTVNETASRTDAADASDTSADDTAGAGATATTSVTVRFFAAAAESAGAEQLQIPLPSELSESGVLVSEFLDRLPELVQQQQGNTPDDDASSGTSSAQLEAPSLERVCARSSFLINGVRADPQSSRLKPGDLFDVLPPFAGG